MNEFNLKRLEETIETNIKKRNFNLKPEILIDYMIHKFNNYSLLKENSTILENILIKLLQNGFGNTVKVYCYYLISNFNHELSSVFFTSIFSDISSDVLSFDKTDVNFFALRNYINLGGKEIIDHYTQLEQIFKSPKYDLNQVTNAFYFSNFPILLMDVFDKLNIDDYRAYTKFLKKFYIELSKILFGTNNSKIEEGAFLNLLSILNKIILRFCCFKNLTTKQRIVNSIIINLSESLIENLDEIIILMQCFDLKYIIDVINFPVYLYKIYILYKDPNSTNKKYERFFMKYMRFLFKEIINIVDPEVFGIVAKTVVEYKILDSESNPECFSTECFELCSKFLDMIDIFVKNNWFDTNMKILSKLISFIDYNDSVDVIFTLIYESKYITNLNDRIITLYNLFSRLILINVDYACNFSEKESLVYCLFKQNWFVILIHDDNPNERDSRFRHDLFITLIEALFYAKMKVLQSGQLQNYINIIKICIDIIEVCFKIIQWADEGESYKMYFLVLEETCLFFDDPFFCFLYSKEKRFTELKEILDSMLIEIAKRFSNKVWNHLAFSNENSKYRSIVLLSQFLRLNQQELINHLLDVIFLRLNEIPFEKMNEKYVEQLLKSSLFLGIRVHYSIRERIIDSLQEFITKTTSKQDVDHYILNNILSFSENILKHLIDNKKEPGVILDSKLVDKLNNEFCLIIPQKIENNSYKKIFNYNNLLLVNINENSHYILEVENTNIDNNTANPAVMLDYFTKLYYYPLLEFNHDYSHIMIDNSSQFRFSDYILISGISDALQIYYKYKLNLEKKEIELFVKSFNISSVVLNKLVFHVGLNKNLIPHNSMSLSQYTDLYSNYQEFSEKLLSPFSTFEFSLMFIASTFDKNNISIDCSFDLNSTTSVTSSISSTEEGTCILSSDSFHIPMVQFFFKDNFALFDSKKFEVFMSALDYSFTTKCFVNLTPEVLIKDISTNFTLIEFKSKNSSFDKSKQIVEQLKEAYYKEYTVAVENNENKNNDLNKSKDNKENPNNKGFDNYEDSQDAQRYNFRIKLSSYCVYNFWIYLHIIGDYNFSNNKSILNIEIRSNDLQALKIIHNEKYVFLSEMMNNKIKFY